MDNKKQKCSLKEHNEYDAISYCQKCEIYICNKCEKHHSSLFPSHKLFNLDKDLSKIFDSFCKVENHHQIESNFFCKNIICYAVDYVYQKLKEKDVDSILILM